MMAPPLGREVLQRILTKYQVLHLPPGNVIDPYSRLGEDDLGVKHGYIFNNL